MSARSSQASEALTSVSSEQAGGSLGNARQTNDAVKSSGDTGPPSPVSRTCGLSTPLPSKPSQFWLGEIPALSAPVPALTESPSIPTSPGSFSAWSDDYAHNGWSARTFLHQMLSISLSRWKHSDTESLLSHSTLAISPLRVAGGSSLSDALLANAPTSSELYLTPQMVSGLARRASSRKRPLQRVLLRTQQGWRRRTVTCTSQGEGYAFSIHAKQKPSKDSPEAGLLAFLEAAVDECSETP